ncbi:MAG TPA: ATP-binding protein [Candidatus Acidoferrum sp.]|nr:ATP-binding protein [Candidatus Acidoferrum sp.]
MTHLSKRKSTPEWPFLVLFHTLTTAFVLLVSGFSSAFPAVWILLLTATTISYGGLGFLISFAGLLVTGGLFVELYPSMPHTLILAMIQEVIISAVIGYCLSFIVISATRDRQALDKTRAQENFQRERLLTLVNSMGDAVVTTDEVGSVKVYNAAFLGLLDTNASLVGKSIDEVLKLVDQNGRHVSIVEDARAIHKVFSRTDLSHRFNQEELIRLYVNVAPIHTDYLAHTEQGFIFIIRDITKEKTLEEERDEFIAIIGHELRTPVAIIEGNLSNIQLLQKRGAAAAIMERAANDAHDQIMYLAKLINDLATLSRAERGINTSGTEEINPTELLTELYKNFLPVAQKAGLRLDLDLSPHLPTIRSSRTYLEEILRNLISNGFKYTNEGSVTIIGHNTRSGVHLAIKDTGIGISKTDQKHIFDKFYRSEDYRTRESTGTGLGLYISKKLAEKLNLTITFESRLNHGSTFGLLVKAIEKR